MRTNAERTAFPWLLALLAPIGAAAVLYGAVYAWAYWPLLAVCTAVGAAGLLRREPSPETARTVKRLSIAFAGIVLALALQLVPVSSSTLRLLSPATHDYLTRVDLTYAEATAVASGRPVAVRHSLSVNPRRTLLASAFFVAFAVYLIGATGILNRASGAGAVATGVAVLGVAVALSGMLLPAPAGAPAGFAPFMNRNHFAGWMSMAASLTLGVFAARSSSLLRRGLHGRSLFLHLGSTEGAKFILTAFGAFVMFAAVLLSQSRSGAMACLAGVMSMAFFAAARPAKGHRSRLAAAAFACILLAAALWAGTAPLLARAERSFGPDLSTRIRAWNDALSVARAFPLAGTGVNTYSDVMLLYQTADSDTHYTSAHNDYLQIAAEGGLLLSVPVLIALLVFGREACARLADDDPQTRTYWIRRGAVAALGAIAAQSVFDFSLQIPANALLFATMCAIAVHERPSNVRTGGHSLASVVEFRLFRRRERVRTV